MSDEIGGVCIVTQPERSQTGKEHTHDLADIIAEITSVAIMTANLPEHSTLNNDHNLIEFSSVGTGQHVFIELFRFVRNQLQLCLYLSNRPEKVVLFFGTTSYVLPVVGARLLGKRVVILPRGDVPLSLQLRWEDQMPGMVARVLADGVRSLEYISYRCAHGIITYTPSMAQQLGLERYEQKLYPNGARFVDTEKFSVSVPFSEREKVVGFIGRLDVEKRVPELAVAAKQLPENIRFVFVGDGDYRESLEQTLAEEIEQGTVEVVGWIDREEVPKQLNRLQLLVVPSHPTEGLPTIILESMACGTPVYATPVAGVPDIVQHGKTGFLIENTDGKQIAKEIEGLVSDPNIGQISDAGRKCIENQYSFLAAVNRFENILQQVA